MPPDLSLAIGRRYPGVLEAVVEASTQERLSLVEN